MMFENVLVGIDGRPAGRDAIALAERLRSRDGKPTLAYVHRGESTDEIADSEKLLERERAALDLDAELVGVVSASPSRGLHEQAERQGADLLVVGSSSHGMLGRAMLGDDTRAALNGAPCAVAIAARGYAEHSTPLAKLGVAYNGTPESIAALAAARELASESGATVHALEVVSLPPTAYGGLVAPAIGDYIKDMLKEATGRMAQLPGVEGRAVYGLAGEELSAFSETMDVLVVGSRGYGPIKRLVLGSTSNYLQRHARCSLLVLPRTSTDTSQSA
jgi:nucleotide-binding universal stress UspA family protein